jgi:NAD(P)-dependent dehydrogenase (short-subunit alcohol dehydrogenase family)
MFTPDTLKGKSILVTGGGSGLGLAMAKGFAAVGANVAICGRTEEKLKAAAEEIQAGGQPGVKVLTHGVDVRDYDAVGVMVKRLVEEFGSLEGLVTMRRVISFRHRKIFRRMALSLWWILFCTARLIVFSILVII